MASRRFNPHQRFNGSFVPECLSRFRGLSPGAKLVWGRFYRYAGSAGGIFPSIETLSEEIGLGPSQTREYVHELIQKGFVDFEQPKGKVRTYFFVEHDCFKEKRDDEPHENVPLRDATGVVDSTPLRDATGVPLRDATPHPSGIPDPKESHLRESTEESHTHTVCSALPEESTTEITVDTICPFLENDFHERTGKKQTLSTKSQQRVRAAFEAMGLPALLAKWEQAHEEGIASLDKFAGTLPAASPSLRNHGRAEAGRGTAAFFSRRSPVGTTYAPKPVVERALPLPEEAVQWNDHVPGMQVKVWDAGLESMLSQCMGNPVFTQVWPEVLQKCSAFDEAGQGRSLAAVLKGDWRKIANRELDWLIKPKNGNGGSNPNKAKIDAMLKGMLNA